MSTGQIFFVVGIVGMLATAVASVISVSYTHLTLPTKLEV